MTKGWKLESARHALARKGIKTSMKERGVAGTIRSYDWKTHYPFQSSKQAEAIILIANELPYINGYIRFTGQGNPLTIVIEGKSKYKLREAINVIKEKGYEGAY